MINKLLENKWIPLSIRTLTLAAFVWLVIIGFASPTNDPVFVSNLSATNLTTSFVWRLWWPLIVLSAIILGRVWCIVCPVEMVTSFFSRAGLKLKRPGWVLSGWVITLFYLVILVVGVTLLQIDMNPKYTSFYLLAIMAVAIVSGLVFEKNTFCRYICPIGYLLGLFAKLSVWGWRVKNTVVCESCRDKSCIKSKYTYRITQKSCGVDLIPANITSNAHCLLCGGCRQTCKKYNAGNNPIRPNPGLVKTGFAADLMQVKSLNLAEWAFLFVLTGSMIFEMTHFQITSGFEAASVPTFFHLKEGLLRDLVEIAYLHLILPAILWTVPYMLLNLRMQIPLSHYQKNFSLVFLPVIAAFFVGLVIMEVVTKIPFYKYIVHDVKGIETVKAILYRQIEIPSLPDWTEWLWSFILILALAMGAFLSMKVARKLMDKYEFQKHGQMLYAMPAVFIILLYIESIAYQLF